MRDEDRYFLCECGSIYFEIDEDYEVERERFEGLAKKLGHQQFESGSKRKCEPTT